MRLQLDQAVQQRAVHIWPDASIVGFRNQSKIISFSKRGDGIMSATWQTNGWSGAVFHPICL